MTDSEPNDIQSGPVATGLPFSLLPEEQAFFDRAPSDAFPLRITPRIRHIVKNDVPFVIRRQFIPTISELEPVPCELEDPLGEKKYSPLSRLVHRYPDRVLILVTGQCAAFCRYCFRRKFTSRDEHSISEDETREILEYLSDKPGIHEILFSGGDPLTLSDTAIFGLLSRFREQSGTRIFRIATRMPFTFPERITEKLVALLGEMAPAWLVFHVNHPDELDTETCKALELFRKAGIPVVSQTVLLRGVNDDCQTLERLFYRLLEAGVKPYYLFQGDLAPGTSHFRVPLKRGMELVKTLRTRISGLAMPTYAVDLPGGGGKIPLTESYFLGETEDLYRYESLEGKEYRYPK